MFANYLSCASSQVDNTVYSSTHKLKRVEDIRCSKEDTIPLSSSPFRSVHKKNRSEFKLVKKILLKLTFSTLAMLFLISSAYTQMTTCGAEQGRAQLYGGSRRKVVRHLRSRNNNDGC